MANLATEVKLYGRWSFEDVEVKDISLEDYIACKPKYAQFLPHSQGRWQTAQTPEPVPLRVQQVKRRPHRDASSFIESAPHHGHPTAI